MITLTAKDVLPEDGTSGTLVGRVHLPDVAGPAVVAVRDDGVFDVSASFSTVSALCEEANPAGALAAAKGTRIGDLESILANTPPGTFLCLLAEAAADSFAPVSLLALLKHPLAAGRQAPADFLRRVRQLDRLALRGPHPDPAEKRLAMQTEDHPVDYADFEGVIPDGEYGAGPMIVWDRGLWRPVGDPREGVKAGKLLFELKGFKLKGMWTLVRIKGETGKEWLLIKETGDGHVRRGVREPYEDSSILSGLGVEDLRERGRRAAEIRAACERLKAARRAVPGAACSRN